jgi:hypothetical protein
MNLCAKFSIILLPLTLKLGATMKKKMRVESAATILDALSYTKFKTLDTFFK